MNLLFLSFHFSTGVFIIIKSILGALYVKELTMYSLEFSLDLILLILLSDDFIFIEETYNSSMIRKSFFLPLQIQINNYLFFLIVSIFQH